MKLLERSERFEDAPLICDLLLERKTLISDFKVNESLSLRLMRLNQLVEGRWHS